MTAPVPMTEPELEAWGTAFGRTLPSGAVLWLEGELGAGKTTLVRAIVAGLGAREEATSPTYALVHRYEGARGPVYHVDCYRLRTEAEARDLDWEGLAAADALLIEWPERAGAWSLRPTHTIRLGHLPDPERRSLSVEAQ